MKMNENLYPQIERGIKFKVFPQNVYYIHISNKNIELSKSGFEVYKYCNGINSIREIYQLLNRNYEFKKESFLKFILEAINLGYLKLLKDSEYKEIIVLGSSKYATPIAASIVLTNKCNLSCTYCYGNYSPSGSLQLCENEINNLYQKLTELGVQAVELSGGEPLINNDFEKILLKSFMYFNNVSILSNGVLFNNRIIEIINTYKEKCFIQLSIDGVSEETNSKVRHAKNTWNRTKNNIRKIIGKGIKVRIVYMLTHDNKHELMDALQLMKELGVTSMAITVIDGVGRGASLKNPDSTSFSNQKSPYFIEIQELLGLAYNKYKDILINDRIHENHKNSNNKNCGIGWKTITIQPNGDISGCQILGEMSKLGNIFNEKYEDIANSPKMKFFQEFSKSIEEEACKNCEYKLFCSSCITRIILANKKRKENGYGLCNIAIKYSLNSLFDLDKHVDFNI